MPRTDPVRLGHLCVWQKLLSEDLMIGNLAAWRADRGDAGSSPARPTHRPNCPAWGWEGVLSVSSLSVPVALRIADTIPDLDLFGRMYAPMATDRAPQVHLDLLRDRDGVISVWRDETCLAATDPSADNPQLGMVLHHQLRKQWYDPYGFMGTIHGSCLEVDGRSVALLGVSGSGKSTLSAWLASRGARYVSDDIFPLSTDGQVFRYPLLPNLKTASWPLLQDAFPELCTGPVFPKGDLFYRMLTSARFIEDHSIKAPKLFVLLTYRAGAELRHVDLTLDEVFLRLAGREFWVASGELENFVGLLRSARFVALEYSDLSQAENFVRTALNSGS